MSDLLPLVFEGNKVDVVEGPDGKPWFVLVDVCKVLGLDNPSAIASRLDESDKMITVIRNEGIRGNPNKTVVSERGVFKVIMRSDKPIAEAFQDAVFEYVQSLSHHGVAVSGLSSDEMALVSDDPMGGLIMATLKIRAQQVAQEARMAELERQMQSLGELENDYVTVVGWFNRNGGTVSLRDAAVIGKMATQLCSEAGIRMGRVKSERFGYVNSYPENIVEQAYEWFKVRT